MNNFKDISGNRYGRLLVIERSGISKSKKIMWLCKCDCGNTKNIIGNNLVSEKSQSCGCLRYEMSVSKATKHKMCGTPEYYSWGSMMNRCRNKNSQDYHHYGARGIKVCKRWHKFENFYKDMGDKPKNKRSIDRIDNNKGYSKSNCRWANQIEQMNNTRKNNYLLFNGIIKTLPQWAEKFKINKGTLYSRLFRSNWSIKKSLETPIGGYDG